MKTQRDFLVSMSLLWSTLFQIFLIEAFATSLDRVSLDICSFGCYHFDQDAAEDFPVIR